MPATPSVAATASPLRRVDDAADRRRPEKPILFSGPMVRAILKGRKTQTRRVMIPQPPPSDVVIKASGSDYSIAPATWDRRPNDFVVCGPVWAVRAALKMPPEKYPVWHCRQGTPGTRLWVRETWAPFHDAQLFTCIKFAADMAVMKPTTWTPAEGSWCEAQAEYDKWRPSIHMPRWACRLILELVSVRVERLQAISEADAIAEGLGRITKDDGRTWKFGIPDRDGLPGTDDDGWPWHDWSADPRIAYRKLWNEINAARGYGWEANPWVWVVEFRRLEVSSQPVGQPA